MLFSNEAVAAAIHDNFEPVWDSLRPVPRVTIDFGNGNVVRRTLHGNVATWVCAADGTALDVLPGVYEPDAWLREMQELVPVHRDFLAARQTTAGNGYLARYHEACLKDGSNHLIDRSPANEQERIPGLRKDTLTNEYVRRMTIHRFLQEQPPASPEAFTPWLYREVLDADLDDPYLGLGATLFGSYPFAEEDAG